MQTSWNLDVLYKGYDDPKIAADKQLIKDLIDAAVKKYSNVLRNADAEMLLAYFQESEKITEVLIRIYMYLHLLTDKDSSNQEAMKVYKEFQAFYIWLQQNLLLLEEEVKLISKESIEQFKQVESLKFYGNALQHILDMRQYQLPYDQERVLSVKSIVSSWADSLENEYRNHLTFPFEEEDWTVKILTEWEIRALRLNVNPKIRERAFMKHREIYGQEANKIVFHNLFSIGAKDWVSDAQLRWFKHAAQKRNVSEQMSDAVIDTMISVTRESYEVYQDFLDLKRRILKQDKLHIWDLYAPSAKIDKEFDFDQAWNLHMTAMQKFDPFFAEFSKEMIESGRIDVFPKKNKRGGAYSFSIKNNPNFVLLNFTGTAQDVMTISHELGHAIHGKLSQKVPWTVYETSLSLAETASNFNELLVADEIMQQLSEKDKIIFLENDIEDSMWTVFRITQYYLFEKELYSRLWNQEDLSRDDLSMLRRSSSDELFNGRIEFPWAPVDDIGWTMIPHFFKSPFYNYPYVFGGLLSLALFQSYKKQWQKFVSDYKEILSSGWTYAPYDLLKMYGHDITGREFYQNWIDHFKSRIATLKQLLS